MPYHEAMKAPCPSFTTSRHNVGAYAVRVYGGRLGERAGHFPEPCVIPDELEAALEFWMTTPYTTISKPVSGGTVASDGSLTLEPERWALRHYRRAIMRGAGVYQAGLWAFLGGQRTKAPQPERAALMFNPVAKGRGGLARYFSRVYSFGTHSRQLTPLPWSAWGRRTLTALPHWHGRALPYAANRLIRMPSLWADITGQPKVSSNGRPTTTNAPGAYLAQLAPILNRIRSTSPRWRGAAGHHSRRLAVLRITVKALRWPQSADVHRPLEQKWTRIHAH